MTIPTLTELPTPPTRKDPANFDERADAFLSKLPTLATESNAMVQAINALIPAINKAGQADEYAEQAAASKAIAAGKATLATEEAEKAGNAQASAAQSAVDAKRYAEEAGARASGAGSWTNETYAVARVSDTVFSVAGDVRVIYPKGRRVRLMQDNPAVVAVESCVLSADNTHVTVKGGTVQGSLSAVAYGVDEDALPVINTDPVGAEMPWQSEELPDVGSYGVWLEQDGSTFDPNVYPELQAHLGSNVLPDLRGEFVRGDDHGRGVDSGRTLGSWQADELKSHSHTLLTGLRGGSGMRFNYDTGVPNGPASTYATGGTETRPRNISKRWLMKAK